MTKVFEHTCGVLAENANIEKHSSAFDVKHAVLLTDVENAMIYFNERNFL